MALTSSGSININAIVGEFGGSAPHALSEYYRNGGEVPGNNTNVPTSGEIKLSDFYSAVNEIQQVYNSAATNLNLSSIFGSNWGTAVPKRVVINSGVTIGATGSNYAINVPTGMGGTLIIDNNGNVQGHGGAANAGGGGNAIHCAQTSGVTINNASGATIKSGGGGGGQGGTGGTGGNGGTGGTGGQGRTGQYAHWAPWPSSLGGCQTYNQTSYPNGGYTTGPHLGGYGYFGAYYVTHCYKYILHNGGGGGSGGTSGGSGGAGGNGGVGQGYNQSAGSGVTGVGGASGSSGSGGSSGGSGAGNGGTGGAAGSGGTGGTGGNGGSFGNAGSNGAAGAQGNTGATGNTGANGNYTNGSSGSGGSAGSSGSSGQNGGAAGYYIYNRASITFNNSGTVAGN